MACYFGHVDVARWLVTEMHAKINHVSNDGMSPLLCAVDKGHLHVVQYLIEEALVDVRCFNGEMLTPLTMARKLGYKAIVEYLCSDYGAVAQHTEDVTGVRDTTPIDSKFQLGKRDKWRKQFDKNIVQDKLTMSYNKDNLVTPLNSLATNI